MPTYEFICKVCGSQFEEHHAFDQNTNQITCPNGHTQTRKIFSVPGIIYKGSGFYITDNRSKKGVAAEKSN
jgi:putative FmdB family regulatory protein